MAVITIPQQTRNAGDYTFGPTTLSTTLTFMDATASIPTADYETAGAGFSLSVQASGDGFATHKDCGYAWGNPAGGPIVDGKTGTTDPAPHFRCTFDPPLTAGMEVRALLHVNLRMKLGFTVTIG